MLVNFFKNIFFNSLPVHEKMDEASLFYNKIKNINFNQLKYDNTQDGLLLKSLEKAIEDNNLSFIKGLYPYIKENVVKIKHDKHCDELFSFATKAMIEDKIDIFDYFINTYIDKRFRQTFSPRFSHWEFSNLIELMIENKRVYYFQILERYGMFCHHDYLESYLSGESYHIRDNTKQLKFMLENFSVKPHTPDWWRFNESKSIDVNELLIAAGKAEEIDSKIIEILLDNGADIQYKNGSVFSLICNKINMDVFDLFKRKNIIINLNSVPYNNPIYPLIKKWNDSKKLADELSNELDMKEIIVKPKINKI